MPATMGDELPILSFYEEIILTLAKCNNSV